jgi:hypothetical protein
MGHPQLVKPTERSLVAALARDDHGNRGYGLSKRVFALLEALVRRGALADQTRQDLQLAGGDADFAVEGDE